MKQKKLIGIDPGDSVGMRSIMPAVELTYSELTSVTGGQNAGGPNVVWAPYLATNAQPNTSCDPRTQIGPYHTICVIPSGPLTEGHVNYCDPLIGCEDTWIAGWTELSVVFTNIIVVGIIIKALKGIQTARIENFVKSIKQALDAKTQSLQIEETETQTIEGLQNEITAEQFEFQQVLDFGQQTADSVPEVLSEEGGVALDEFIEGAELVTAVVETVVEVF